MKPELIQDLQQLQAWMNAELVFAKDCIAKGQNLTALHVVIEKFEPAVATIGAAIKELSE